MRLLTPILFLLLIGCDIRHESSTPAHNFTYDDFGPVVLTVDDPIVHDEPNRYTIHVRWIPRGSFPVVIYRSAGDQDFEAIGASHSSVGQFTDQVPHRSRYRYYVTSLDQDLAESRSHIVQPLMPSPDIVVEGDLESRGYVGYNRVFLRDNTKLTVVDRRFLVLAGELHIGNNVEIFVPEEKREVFQTRVHILSFKWKGELKITRKSSSYHTTGPVLITSDKALVTGDSIDTTKISHDFIKMMSDPPDSDPYWKSEAGKRDLEEQATLFHHLLEMFPNREFTKEQPAHSTE